MLYSEKDNNGSVPLGIGVDIVEISRFNNMAESFPKGASRRIFTDNELLDKRINIPQFMASRFAAKEAVMKCMGRGMDSIGFTDIEIENLSSGQPVVNLFGRALEVAGSMGVTNIMLSISHSMSHAIAFAMAMGKGKESCEVSEERDH